MSRKKVPDLAALLLEAVRLQKSGDNKGCISKLNEYITLRRTFPEPSVTLLGQSWKGDHVMSSYKRAAQLELVTPNDPQYWE